MVGAKAKFCRVLPVATAVVVAALSGIAAAQEAGPEHIGVFADIDWSLGLRGSYASSSATGGTFEGSVVPELSWKRHGESTDTTLGVGGDIALQPSGHIQIDDLHATGDGQLRLDRETTLKGNGSLVYDQLRLDDTSLPVGTTTPPTELTGTIAGSATHDFGHIDVTGRLGGTRYVEGPTGLGGGVSVDNAEHSYWQGNAGLRLGYDLGPLINVFIDGDEKYTAYDAPSTTLLTYQNGRTSTLTAGVAYTRNSTLTGEISAGRAWLDYDDPTLTDTPSWVAKGSVTLRPDETFALTGALDTSLAPSTLSAGDTDAGLTASGNVSYLLNPWVTLRGSASYARTLALTSGLNTWDYTLGAGVDFATSRFAKWTGDYSFAHQVGSTGTATDTHKVIVGVTFHR